jgi:hypothetical protein
LIKKIERPSQKLATYVNAAWPHYKADEALMKSYGSMGAVVVKESREVLASTKPEIEAFKRASQSV